MPTFKKILTAIIVGLAALTTVLFILYGQYAANKSIYSGFVEFGFESQSFRPCGGGPQWWLMGPALPELSQRYQELAGAHYQPLYAELQAVLSEPGNYGHMGVYEREMEVVEVVALDIQGPADCDKY